jgi:hypothetical protein
MDGHEAMVEADGELVGRECCELELRLRVRHEIANRHRDSAPTPATAGR